MGIDEVIGRMRSLAAELDGSGDQRLAFHTTYLRTTEAVAAALRAGLFDDPTWVERWDVVFADLYLAALDAGRRGDAVPRPWGVAFAAAADGRARPALQHVLLGMNAHINYDLPQALLAVISDEEFADPAVLARREADHRRIDEVLAARVRAEDAELQAQGLVTWRDRALQPLNQMATRRFLREARAKVWANALALSAARAQGGPGCQRLLAQLEGLSAARVADLEKPGPVLLRLAVRGFGVLLPGATLPRPARESRRGAVPPGLTGGGPGAGSGEGKRRVLRPGGGRGPARLRSFDPVRVGNLEAAVWASYYRRQWGRFLAQSVLLVRAAFGMDWVRTVHGAWLVLRANQLWAPADGDPAGARRCMRRFYALLRLAHGEPADPAEAARLEVDWWAVHRAHQRGEDGGAGPLADALARLNACLYRTSEARMRPAARHRARAMGTSDAWVAAGCPAGSPLLPAIRAELVRSYAALLTVVHR